MRKRMIKYALVVVMIFTIFTTKGINAEAVTISVDGDSTEWMNAAMMSSSHSAVEKWAVAKDSDRLYFYIQQNGGNAYGMPASYARINISYPDGTAGRATMIQFDHMFHEARDAWYGPINGVDISYLPSEEANKYEIEVSVPLSFFTGTDFVLEYCGSTISISDIPDMKDIEEPVMDSDAYSGIVIDGSFKDWRPVSKNHYDDSVVTDIAMVFDGDWVYIYIKEIDDRALTWSGECSNGNFTIYTDTGRNTTFQVRPDEVIGIEGAMVAHSNKQYEVAIPASAIKQYKETISLGFYMNENMLVTDVANLQGNPVEDTSFNGIVYDGKYDDWDYYPHQLIQYSTPGAAGGDSEAALFTADTTLFGHVKSYLHKNEGEFQPFSIRVNNDDNKTINFRLVTVDAEGNINRDPDIRNLPKGTYEYYLWDLNSTSTATNINDADAPVYGQMYLTVGTSFDEMEYKIDLEKLADHFNMDASDFKMIQAQYINIGTEWVSIAGTSTYPVMGVCLSIFSVAGALYFRKRKRAVTK
ncbi:MAG: Firmicu-CTERM sorting domain-containing protein [Lachnospira sp.]